MFRLFLTALMVSTFLMSCNQNANSDETKNKQNISKKQEHKALYQNKIDFTAPKVGQVYKQNEAIAVDLKITEDDRIIDSIKYLFNRKEIELANGELQEVNLKAGKNIITAIAYMQGNKEEISTHIIGISELAPQKKSVKKIKEYPHDVTAYTQGLIYTDKFLYEGTGQPRESMLKKIDLEKNELIQSYNLPGEVFGEGIVLHNQKIYQLTWQSRRAFVYDLKTFALVHEFQYDTEGWGITNYYDNLIMSDGTQNLYIIDPESFSIIDQLQVSTNIGPVNNINELEWINGKIWANVYLTNTIVIIDPETGFVETELDLSHLVPDSYANPHDNVLNGIAYDKKNNRIFVTGKRWPVLYEISISD
jgi:glutamine cyclotransferase